MYLYLHAQLEGIPVDIYAKAFLREDVCVRLCLCLCYSLGTENPPLVRFVRCPHMVAAHHHHHEPSQLRFLYIAAKPCTQPTNPLPDCVDALDKRACMLRWRWRWRQFHISRSRGCFRRRFMFMRSSSSSSSMGRLLNAGRLCGWRR
jgi:hypothetical protein